MIPEVGKPFDKLCRVVLVESNVREERFKQRRAWIAGEEEHEFGLAEVDWR